MSDRALAVPRPRRFYTEPDWLEVGELRVAYRRNGAGEPVLYLHGAGATRMWLPFYEQLAASVDLVAPEHPGFGETELPEWMGGFDDLVLHYRDVVDALGLERFHLAGFSLGGWIAAELAVFYPERLKSLTLIAPAGLYVPGKPLADLFAMPPENIAHLALSGDVEPYADYFPDGTDLDEIVHAWGELATFARFTWAPHHDPKLPRRLRAVRVPTLLVGAEDDWVVPNEHLELWAELIEGARVVRIPGTGHLLMIQEPERTAETVAGFVQEVSR
jgi:pimeloyl-ACP methyl ester carboxylesterase